MTWQKNLEKCSGYDFISDFYYYLEIFNVSVFQETLEKMRERIEITSGNFDGPDLPIQQRMEELKLSLANEG